MSDINRLPSLSGTVCLPGDKSITHRSILFGAIANGVSRVKMRTVGRDNLASLRIVSQLGVRYELQVPSHYKELAEQEKIILSGISPDEYCYLKIFGVGLDGLTASNEPLDCGNSGTSARLLCGLLAGFPFKSTLCGDESLSKRPFKRVTAPLSQMGASFSAENLPLEIIGSKALSGINHISANSSAQVKSAILLAGLHSDQPVTITEPTQSRDHTERMFSAMGCELRQAADGNGNWVVQLKSVPRANGLSPLEVEVPGDYSAAAFFVVAASIIPNSKVTIENVGFNKSRIGLHHILLKMGARIDTLESREVAGEEVVNLCVSSAPLVGVEISGEDVALAIDEIPILAVAAAFANGTTRIRGAEELRVKESDRIAMVAALLKSFSIKVEEFKDGLSIEGNPNLLSSNPAVDPQLEKVWRNCGDHRISMAGAILEFALSGHCRVSNVPAVETSFPKFKETFESLLKN